MITELVADSRLGVRCRLRAIDPWRAKLLRAGSDWRRRARNALTPSKLARKLEGVGFRAEATKLGELTREELLLSGRVAAQTGRRMLASILERQPMGDDLRILTSGAGSPLATDWLGKIAATIYGRSGRFVGERFVDDCETVNDHARVKFGKPIFLINREARSIEYQGLWGNPNPWRRGSAIPVSTVF